MTSSNGNIFCVTGPLCGEFTGHRWIPHTKPSDEEFRCFLWSAPWINGWVNNCEAGDLRRHRAHYDVIVMRIGITMKRQNLSYMCREALKLHSVSTNTEFLSSGLLASALCWPRWSNKRLTNEMKWDALPPTERCICWITEYDHWSRSGRWIAEYNPCTKGLQWGNRKNYHKNWRNKDGFKQANFYVTRSTREVLRYLTNLVCHFDHWQQTWQERMEIIYIYIYTCISVWKVNQVNKQSARCSSFMSIGPCHHAFWIEMFWRQTAPDYPQPPCSLVHSIAMA